MEDYMKKLERKKEREVVIIKLTFQFKNCKNRMFQSVGF